MSGTAEILSEEQMAVQKQLMQEIASREDRPRTYHIVTYGCQMNAHDSELIAGMLEEMGMTPASKREEADFVLFNTFCVRENAERRALGNVTWLNEVKKKRPDMMIAVCGCMVQEKGMAERIIRQYGFVDLAFGTSNLYRFPELFLKALHAEHVVVEVSDRNTVAEGLPARRARRDAAYISIMQGCNNFCTYCIVPYVRGRERSRKMEDILREAEELQAAGVQEVMLLGQNVNSYGAGTQASFPELLQRVDALGIPRIRFMTSHPKDLSDRLIEVMAQARHVLPQFHLPVQSGSDRILMRMNRHYTRAQYLERVQRLREAVPGIGLTTDLIVAFPGETEEDFADTMSLVERVGYDSAFTFIYSPRVGTQAASFTDQIAPETAKVRIQALIALQEMRQREAMRRFLGTEEEVLVEGLSKRSERFVSGHGTHGVSVTLPGSSRDIGTIVKVRIEEIKNNTLLGSRQEET